MYIQYELILDTIIIYKHKQIHINTYIYLIPIYQSIRASLVAKTVKSLSAMQETWVQSLGWEDPLEKEMANHSSILAWKIPWTEEPGRLQPMGLQRVRQDWETSLTTYLCRDKYIHIQATYTQESWVGKIPGRSERLPHCSILAWSILWTV